MAEFSVSKVDVRKSNPVEFSRDSSFPVEHQVFLLALLILLEVQSKVSPNQNVKVLD